MSCTPKSFTTGPDFDPSAILKLAKQQCADAGLEVTVKVDAKSSKAAASSSDEDEETTGSSAKKASSSTTAKKGAASAAVRVQHVLAGGSVAMVVGALCFGL